MLVRWLPVVALLLGTPSPTSLSKHVFLGDQQQLEVDPDQRTALLSANHEPRILLDYNVGIKAYKEPTAGRCYVERLEGGGPQRRHKKGDRREYIVGRNFTKYEFLKVAGLQVVNFCRNTLVSVYEYKTSLASDDHLVSNEIQNEPIRRKRQTAGGYGPRRYRGQTQTQYVAFNKEGNGNKSGIAEAVAQPDLARATVSGSHGMGQAQSQSGSGGCEECFPPGYAGGYGPQQAQAGAAYPGGYPVGPDGRVGQPGIPGRPGSGQYPGHPGTGIYPGGGAPGAYPGGTAPGAYPGFPQGPPGTGVPGKPGFYPGGPGSYPSGVPSLYPIGPPGAGQNGGYPGAGVPGVARPGHSAIPGAVPGAAPSGPTGITYPSAGGSGTYPGGPGPRIPGGYLGVGVPGAGVPGAGLPSGYPGVGISGGYPGVGVPGAGVPGAGVPGAGVPGGYPGVGMPGAGVPGAGVPGAGVQGAGVPGGYPGAGVSGGYPGAGVPGGYPGTGIPGGYPGAGVPGIGVGVPGSGMPGAGIPGGYPGAGVSGVGVPGSGTQGAGIPGGYPGAGVPGGYPGTGIPGAGVPGGYPGSGVSGYPPGYPGITSGPQTLGYPGVGVGTGIGTGTGVGTGIGTGTGVGTGIGTGQGVGVGTGTGVGIGGGVGVGGYGPGTAVGGVGGGDTQAQSSVQYEGKETKLGASSQGKFGDGIAQTQVSGSYSGSGVFSAQAQTSDKDKGAQSQIDGGEHGATSLAQGRAGASMSQAQVQLGNDNGATIAESQSTGFNFGTNTQVQAGTKGGLADAQSKGQGSTQSQAQIGFTPYQKGLTPEQDSVFRGGGSASSQTGSISGQSQSQIQGSFKYGVTYSGAAQAGSGVTGMVFPKLNLTAGSTLYNFSDPSSRSGPISSDPNDKIGIPESSNPQSPPPDPLLGSSGNVNPEDMTRQPSSPQNYYSPNEGLQRRENNQFNYNTGSLQPSNAQSGGDKDDDDDDEYDDEYDDDEDLMLPSGQLSSRAGSHTTPKPAPTPKVQPSQTQHVILGPNVPHGAKVIRDSVQAGDVFQPGQQVPGTAYTVPSGFRGKVKSVAGDTTEASASGGGQAQTQTVLLTPGAGNITYIDKSQSKQELLGRESYYNRNKYPQPTQQNNYYGRNKYGTRALPTNYQQPASNKNYDSFVTVTNSETGEMNGDKIDPKKKVTHTYYTKSSTCGYFTFTCNAIHGSNGRTKICKPNPPTYADGTPCGYH